MKTIEAAQGRWKGIITMLGCDPKFLEDRHQACPFCGGKDRFRFDDKDGSGSYFCSGCGAGYGMDFVRTMRGWDFPTAAREVDAIIGRVRADKTKSERSETDKRNALIRILRGAGRISPDSPSWIYLNRRCGNPDGILNDLRHHPAIKHTGGGSHPALLAILRYPDGTGACVHRTYLTVDGQKASVDPVRMMMPAPSPLSGSAIRLGPLSERLGIAEGIETSICVGKLAGLNVWSAVSANGLENWVPPEEAKSIAVFGDNDVSFTGQEAAYSLAKRLKTKGLDVEVHIPPIVGKDYCDIWCEMYNGISQSEACATVSVPPIPPS